MGKYMRRKNKTSGEVSLMEVPSLNGVLTRAKTLALQNASVSSVGAGSYIQLRSRRLVKPNLVKKQKVMCVDSVNPRKFGVADSVKLEVDSSNVKVNLVNSVEKLGEKEDICREIGDEEGSIGENMVEIEGRERTTRESTPCSLIRDPDAIKIPGSSTKSTRPTEVKYRVQDTSPRQIPSTSEMEEFFTGPEKQQQQLFIEKYNFDPVNDKPLPGRYEWVKLDDTKKS
ncbi:putative cyclin-dependent kinase inhibitor [Helianthus anomalus]